MKKNIKGQEPSKEKKTVYITGARFCSEYGRYVARMYGHGLAAKGYQVANGLALGVEGIAVRGALEAGGSAFQFAGTGTDVCYPPENKHLQDQLVGVLSTLPDGTLPKRETFNHKYDLLPEYVDAVVIIEARKKSGTLIAADVAMKNNIPVYVVPGRVTDRLSDGCNQLLKEGALLTMTPDDIEL